MTTCLGPKHEHDVQSTQLILDGDEAQTVVARLSTDAGKIPGAFGVDRSVVRETLEAIFHELFADVADRVLISSIISSDFDFG